jgi:hypothetical protein
MTVQEIANLKLKKEAQDKKMQRAVKTREAILQSKVNKAKGM